MAAEDSTPLQERCPDCDSILTIDLLLATPANGCANCGWPFPNVEELMDAVERRAQREADAIQQHLQREWKALKPFLEAQRRNLLVAMVRHSPALAASVKASPRPPKKKTARGRHRDDDIRPLAKRLRAQGLKWRQIQQAIWDKKHRHLSIGAIRHLVKPE